MEWMRSLRKSWQKRKNGSGQTLGIFYLHKWGLTGTKWKKQLRQWKKYAPSPASGGMIDILHNAEWRVIWEWSSDYCIVSNVEIGSGRPEHSGMCVPLSVSNTSLWCVCVCHYQSQLPSQILVCVWVFLDLQSNYNNSITG